MRKIALFSFAVMLAGCSGPATETATSASPAERSPVGADLTGDGPAVRALNLPDYFDCVREAGGILLAAHRGGPAPGYPENALETLQHNWDAGVASVFEIDVAESRDGLQFLMHDRSLGRTTTGSGPVADTDWEEISRLRLVDNDGTRTDFHPPKLTDVLLWAVETGAILELDRKGTTSFRNIVNAVRAADAEENVILISYSDNEAIEIASLAPDLMMTASVLGDRDVARLEENGVKPSRLIGWTGTREVNPAAFQRLRDIGVEPAFGTLGRRGERLDDLWLADGDASEFEAAISAGLVLLATDAAEKVGPLISADETAYEACGR